MERSGSWKKTIISRDRAEIVIDIRSLIATIFSVRIADWTYMLIAGWRDRFLALVLRMNLIRILKKLTLYVLEYFHSILVFSLSNQKWPFQPFHWFSWNFDFLWMLRVENTFSWNHIELETFEVGIFFLLLEIFELEVLFRPIKSL